MQLYRHNPNKTLDANIRHYFIPESLEADTALDLRNDKEESEVIAVEQNARVLRLLLNPPPRGLSSHGSTFELKDRAKMKRELAAAEKTLNRLQANKRATEGQRRRRHYTDRVKERITVLECLLQILPQNEGSYGALIRDMRRFLAESGIMLNLRSDEGSPARIVPIDEPLLQREVIDHLLSRLSKTFPERARELVNAYHNLIGGKDGDTIFIEAFKSLEQFARDLTGDAAFLFDKSHLDKHFPLLHGTIHQTFIRLDGHRGDKGGHGKNAPPPHELRYLLFAICNAALLLLDYPIDSARVVK